MISPFLSLTILSTLSAGAVFQDPEKGEGRAVQDASATKDSSQLTTWDDKQAKAAIAEFKKSYKNKAKLQVKLAALEKLRTGRSSMLVKPLVRVVRTEKKYKTCRNLAAELLGNQPKGSVRKQLLILIYDAKIKRKPAVVSALIRAHSKASYESRDWRDLERLFRKDLADRRYPQVQKAIMELVTQNKEYAAMKLLLESIDPPEPAWVDDPNNPPASYWEARWKNWEVWRADVKEALYQITEQRFGNAKEAKAWLSKNRKELAKKYKKKKKGRRR